MRGRGVEGDDNTTHTPRPHHHEARNCGVHVLGALQRSSRENSSVDFCAPRGRSFLILCPSFKIWSSLATFDPALSRIEKKERPLLGAGRNHVVLHIEDTPPSRNLFPPFTSSCFGGQGQPCSLAHCRTSRWPLAAANMHVV